MRQDAVKSTTATSLRASAASLASGAATAGSASPPMSPMVKRYLFGDDGDGDDGGSGGGETDSVEDLGKKSLSSPGRSGAADPLVEQQQQPLVASGGGGGGSEADVDSDAAKKPRKLGAKRGSRCSAIFLPSSAPTILLRLPAPRAAEPSDLSPCLPLLPLNHPPPQPQGTATCRSRPFASLWRRNLEWC